MDIEDGIDRCYLGCLEPEHPVRTTINLDDDLLAKAQRFTGITEKTEIVRAALRALVEREAARRMALMGGSDPKAEAAPRRRSDP